LKSCDGEGRPGEEDIAEIQLLVLGGVVSIHEVGDEEERIMGLEDAMMRRAHWPRKGRVRVDGGGRRFPLLSSR